MSLGAVDVAAGILLIFPPFFWYVEIKSDSGRRDSNSGSERSQPKALTIAFFYFCLLIPGFLHIFFTYFFSRINVAMHYYFFFFILSLLLCLKFKPLLRCANVRYFNLCPESLDAKTGQFASLLGRDGRGVLWD